MPLPTLIEGLLERRGQGIVGRWDQEYFRVSGDVLESFELQDAQHAQAISSLRVHDIVNLTLEEDRRECSFFALGTKVRLRAQDTDGIRAWYNAFQNILLSRGPDPATDPKELQRMRTAGSIAADPRDVWVQIDQLARLQRGPAAAEYIVRCQWSGSTEEIGETQPKAAAAGEAEVADDDCSIRQQLHLQGVAGQHKVLISVHRLADGRSSLIGQRELSVDDVGVGKGQHYPLIDMRGRQLNSTIRLKLKLGSSARSGQSGEQQPAQVAVVRKQRSISPPPVRQPVDSDVWVQVDFVRGIPCSGGLPMNSYFVTAHWLGRPDAGSRTDHHLAAPSAAGENEDCAIRQQTPLNMEPGEHTTVVGVWRVGERRSDDDQDSDVLLGTTTLYAGDQANAKGHLRELLDEENRRTNIYIKLKLMLSDPASSPSAGSQRRSVHGVRSQLSDAQKEAAVAKKRSATRRSVRSDIIEEVDERPDLSPQQLVSALERLDEFLRDEKLRVKDLFLNAALNPSYKNTKTTALAPEEMQSILSKAGLEVEHDQIVGLVKYFDRDGTGKMDVLELQNGLRRLHRGNLLQELDDERRSISSQHNEGSRHGGSSRGRSLSPTSRGRSVSPSRVSSAGNRKSIVETTKQVAAMSDNPIENCLGNLQRLLDSTRLRTADLFRSAKYNPKFSQTGDETFNGDELHQALVIAGIVLPARDCQLLVGSLDTSGKGKVNITQLDTALRAYRRGKDVTKRNASLSPRKPQNPNELHLEAMHRQHQENKEKLLAKKEAIEKEKEAALESEKLKNRVGTRRALTAERLDTPDHAAARLYEEAKSHQYRKVLRQQMYLELERKELERARTPNSRRGRALSAPSAAAAAAAAAHTGERLHTLHAQRLAAVAEARKAKMAEELRELDKVGLEAKARIQKEHDQQYRPRFEELLKRGEQAQKFLEIKRQQKVEKETTQLLAMKDWNGTKGANGKTTPRTPREVDQGHLDELYGSYEHLQRKREQEKKRQEELAAAKLRREIDETKNLCLSARPEALKAVTSRVKESAENVFLKPGFLIRVVEVMSYEFVEKKRQYELLPGHYGTIIRIDQHGDALVNWERIGERWLMKRNFAKVLVDQERKLAQQDKKKSHRMSLFTSLLLSDNQETEGQFFDCAQGGEEPMKPQQPSKGVAFGSKEDQREGAAPSKDVTRMPTVEHVMQIVNGALASRCGRQHEDAEMMEEIRRMKLGIPTDEILRIYRLAKTESYREARVPERLQNRESQRLFNDGQLISFSEGWHRCVEPDVIRQVQENFDAILDSAVEAQAALLAQIGPEDPERHDRATLDRMWPSGGRWTHPHASSKALFAFNPGPKARKDANAKAFVRYGPAEGPRRYRNLVDLARVSLVYSDAAMLNAALDDILKRFEVCQIRNFYHPQMQTLLGDRYVEVLVIITDRLEVPHVCEIRLEELSFFDAREKAWQHLKSVQKGFSEIYGRTGRDKASIEYLVKHVLYSPKSDHRLKIFRRHLAQKWGCVVNVWRKMLGPREQLVGFRKFRDVCCQQGQRESTARFWQELDSGFAGNVSLFELDPDTVILLVKLFARLLIIIQSRREDITAEVLFAHLTHNLPKLHHPDRLEVREFRHSLRALGFSNVEADRLFKSLDQGGSAKKEAVMHITSKEVGWLAKLPLLVDVDAVMLTTAMSSDMIQTRATAWGERSQDTLLQMARVSAAQQAEDHFAAMGSQDSALKIAELNKSGRVRFDPQTRVAKVLDPLRCRAEPVAVWEDQRVAAAVLDDLSQLCRVHRGATRIEIVCGRPKPDDGKSQLRCDLLRQGLVSRGVAPKTLFSSVIGLASDGCNTVLRFCMEDGQDAPGAGSPPTTPRSLAGEPAAQDPVRNQAAVRKIAARGLAQALRDGTLERLAAEVPAEAEEDHRWLDFALEDRDPAGGRGVARPKAAAQAPAAAPKAAAAVPSAAAGGDSAKGAGRGKGPPPKAAGAAPLRGIAAEPLEDGDFDEEPTEDEESQVQVSPGLTSASGTPARSGITPLTETNRDDDSGYVTDSGKSLGSLGDATEDDDYLGETDDDPGEDHHTY